jgi:hypothetical protein
MAVPSNSHGFPSTLRSAGRQPQWQPASRANAVGEVPIKAGLSTSTKEPVVLREYWLLGVGAGMVVVAVLYGAIMHSWRASTRYKRPLDAPAGPRPPNSGR